MYTVFGRHNIMEELWDEDIRRAMSYALSSPRGGKNG